MRSFLIFSCALFLSLQFSYAGTVITPTTTLSAETSKNTSAADSFAGTPNGNISSQANVSKVPTSALIYPGATTKIYAHYMPWFGFGNHVNVGYSSTDATEINAQISDMLSRGITGMVIDWYGQGSNEDQSTLVIKPQVEARNGQFEFAIMEDAGSRTLSGCSTTSTCTSALITDLKYIYSTYEGSPDYMRWNGNPVVFFFGVESLPIDWTSVRANVAGNPVFIFENSGSFSRSYAGGAFSWVQPSDATTSDPMDLRYLDNFYSTALTYSSKLPYGTGYKGFNDSIASWSANRFMDQQCGQTWVQTLAEINKYYSTSTQLARIQLVTWNDYEEGTEIETGIDNCLTVNAAVNANTLSWSVTGQESTLDHYTAFISTDGQKLMPLGDYPVTTHTVDLSSFAFDSGTYTLYVKAVGKPSIVNHMSAAVTYVSGSSQNQAPVARLSVSPTSGTAPVTVTADTSTSTATNATIVSSSINWGDGSTSAGPTASHTYANAGTYAVTATVTDSNGLSGTTSATVTVTTAQITPKVTVTSPTTNSTVGPQIHVVASGVAPNPITAMQIYLDDQFVYQVNASQIDTVINVAPGAHWIVAKLWESTGDTALSSTINITVVDQPPVAVLNVSPLSGTGPLTVTASTSGSSDPDGSIASSSIDFGDGTVVSGTTASHTYSNAGTYTVKATVIDNYGVASSVTATVTVSPSMTARTIVMTSPTPNSTVYGSLHVTGSAAGPAGVSAMQIYIDGNLKYQINASSVDTWLDLSKGKHRVTLKAWDSTGASWMTSAYVMVKQ